MMIAAGLPGILIVTLLEKYQLLQELWFLLVVVLSAFTVCRTSGSRVCEATDGTWLYGTRWRFFRIFWRLFSRCCSRA